MTKFTIAGDTANAHIWAGASCHGCLRPVLSSPAAIKKNEIVANENAAISNVRRLVTAELGYVSRNQNACGTMRISHT